VCPRRPPTAIGCASALLLRQFIATMTKLDHPDIDCAPAKSSTPFMATMKMLGRPD